jgi:hypothetical protein
MMLTSVISDMDFTRNHDHHHYYTGFKMPILQVNTMQL